MPKAYKAIALGFASVTLSGCADTIHVTLNCDPIGASLHEAETNRNLGVCPKTFDYAVTEQDRQNGYVTLKGITATWVSGASASYSSIRAVLKLGDTPQVEFDRPRSVPGYDVDANYALNVQRNAILAQQAQAAIEANNLTKSLTVINARPTSCTTTQIGNMLQTNCH